MTSLVTRCLSFFRMYLLTLISSFCSCWILSLCEAALLVSLASLNFRDASKEQQDKSYTVA